MAFAFLRRHRLALLAAVAPLAALLAVTAPALVQGAEEQTDDNPNFRRVALTSPGATLDILGQPEPLGTGAFAGEVDLARQPGEEAMTTANLVLAMSGEPGASFGDVAVTIRHDSLADYRYNPDTPSIVFSTGLEFEAERAPTIGVRGQHVFLYTGALRLLPTETVEPTVFPPEGQTFRLPSPVLLWEGAQGVTSSEPIGMLTAFEVTVTHPA
jgi:hypothetical protein